MCKGQLVRFSADRRRLALVCRSVGLPARHASGRAAELYIPLVIHTVIGMRRNVVISKGRSEERMQARLARAFRCCQLYAGGWTWEQAVKGSKVAGVPFPPPRHGPPHAVVGSRTQSEISTRRGEKGAW